MKYRYSGAIPTLVLIQGKLRTIRRGDIVSIANPPSSEFVREVEYKKAAPVAPKAAKPKKRTRLDGSSS
jgi:hypothetical protein